MANQGYCVVLLSLTLLSLAIHGSLCFPEINEDNNGSPSTTAGKGKRWAVLVAGSNGYYNYRHQADICHAYQILKKGGLKDENIIVFMYDDIAYNSENPRKGVIINKPNGPDVYKGVPKDYTGTHVNAQNLYAVILGNKSALTGGSGKVLSSGLNDHVFIYYADHGSVGLLGMPSDRVYAKDLISVLQKKNASKGYKSMVFYIEACEAGSMFEGLLSSNLNIYATTASNAEESSYGTYCPGDLSVPAEFDTCLGDLYSISWMEDCDISDLHKETLDNQYQRVRRRTTNSHVMQYGDMSHKQELLFAYMGADLSIRSLTSTSDISSPSISRAVNQRDTKLLFAYMGADLSIRSLTSTSDISSPSISRAVNQRDTKLLYLQQKLQRAPAGSQEKQGAQKQLLIEIAHRKNVDYSITKLGEVLFGHEKSSNVLMNVRPQGQPVVDNWDCFKNFLDIYEKYCGHLSTYGMKYTRAMANICNAGITTEKMVAASDQTCANKPNV